MAIEQEVETIGPEIKDPDISYIQDLSKRLLEEVNIFLQDFKSIPTNVGSLKAKLEFYESGDFQLAEVDFNCLERSVDFVIKRRGRGDEFKTDVERLAEVREKLQNEKN